MQGFRLFDCSAAHGSAERQTGVAISADYQQYDAGHVHRRQHNHNTISCRQPVFARRGLSNPWLQILALRIPGNGLF